ncbi:hypothetical protein [Pseudomonas phage PA1C]|nr:hypothetical protein [Pseudomonas phage PA1C]
MYSTKPKCKKEITMKQYREPTTRLTKEKLEWVIERRKERKAESPFGRAHFPAGTRAIFESCSLRFLDENERVYPGQCYETFEATVLGIVANGHDSYIAVLDKPCNLIEDASTASTLAGVKRSSNVAKVTSPGSKKNRLSTIVRMVGTSVRNIRLFVG